ncbi:hypothetical protein KAOT1_16808 [Kordia algicida OT-1]|uniref:Uncharacterized protein n=1 Tax=Kordia algicida OT-1 TaxID=391587 RepID=A9DRU2_9FLAO|nr:hypothetical protein KAOT1_16808 [Kordia algicida OT-1]
MKYLKILPIIASIITITVFIMKLIGLIEIDGVNHLLPKIHIDSIFSKVVLMVIVEFVIAFSYGFILYIIFKKSKGIGCYTYIFLTIFISWIRLNNYKVLFFPDKTNSDLHQYPLNQNFYMTLIIGTIFFSIILTSFITRYREEVKEEKIGCLGIFMSWFIAYISQYIFMIFIISIER